jgi:hypothetical protein
VSAGLIRRLSILSDGVFPAEIGMVGWEVGGLGSRNVDSMLDGVAKRRRE